MNENENFRLKLLSTSEMVPIGYLDSYYGLNWPFVGELLDAFEHWRGSRRNPANPPNGNVSRYEIEGFLHAKKVVPRKWMAARLGMSVASFDQLADRLKDIGMQPSRYLPYEQMAADTLSEDIVSSLSTLKFRTFGDHNSFCLRLKKDLENELQIEITTLLCATSVELQDFEQQIANTFDCLTLEPLSTKHCEWLDFGKPLTFSPDRCSKLLLARNLKDLTIHLAGSKQPDLSEYSLFIAQAEGKE